MMAVSSEPCIVPFQPEHAAGVLAVSDATLGQGYLASLGPVLTKPGLVFGVALDGHEVVGFVFGWRLERGGLSHLYPDLFRRPRPTLVAEAEASWRLGILKTIAVAPGWQGRGLGVRLFRGCAQRLQREGASAIVVPAWTVQEQANLGPLLDREGFAPFARIERPWSTECDDGALCCPVRGEGPCVCGLRLYAKAL